MSISATALQDILNRIKRYIDSHSGGASNFSDLSDVTLTDVQNGQIPKYNATTQKWENANESAGGSSNLADLNDVAISNLTNNQGLLYDEESGKWKNKNLPNDTWNDVQAKPFSTIGEGLTVEEGALNVDFKYIITNAEPATIEDNTIVFVYE